MPSNLLYRTFLAATLICLGLALTDCYGTATCQYKDLGLCSEVEDEEDGDTIKFIQSSREEQLEKSCKKAGGKYNTDGCSGTPLGNCSGVKTKLTGEGLVLGYRFYSPQFTAAEAAKACADLEGEWETEND